MIKSEFNSEEVYEALTKPAVKEFTTRQNWIMIHKGEPYCLNGDKFIWNRPNHVKSALTQAFQNAVFNEGITYERKDKMLADFKKWREENIEIVRLEEWIIRNKNET